MMVCLPNRTPYQWQWSLSPIGGIVVLVFVLSTETFASQNSIGLWYQVREGNTVWDLANGYRGSMQSIVSTNKIRSANRLPVGKKLLVPGESGSKQEHRIWHKVQRGDTLWGLAKKHGVSVQSIVSTNRMPSANP